MAKSGAGWVNTTKTDRVNEYRTSNVLKGPSFLAKVQRLPSLNVSYETPRTPAGKQWTDQSLLSTRSVDNYLAESDAFQRASFANIVDKWKQYDRNKTNRLISSFDSHYNMKIRFRQDDNLNRTSEMKYAPVAKYYRFLGSENNAKHGKPCTRHKRRTQEYEERHIRELLTLPPTVKTRSQPYFLPKITNHSHMDTTIQSTPTIRSSVSVAELSHHTFS